MDSAKTAIANYVAGNVPMISLWPTTGFSDTTVYGKGFASNSQIHLTLNGSDTSNGPVVVSSDEAGSFTAILNRVSLNQNAGNYTVQAIDGSGGSAIAYFLALEPAKGLDGPAGQNGQDLPPGYLAGYILLYIIVALVSAWAITRWRQRKGDEEGNQANKQQLL
jgi:hypothetical protein